VQLPHFVNRHGIEIEFLAHPAAFRVVDSGKLYKRYAMPFQCKYRRGDFKFGLRAAELAWTQDIQLAVDPKPKRSSNREISVSQRGNRPPAQ
jgi:hypothetical protein